MLIHLGSLLILWALQENSPDDCCVRMLTCCGNSATRSGWCGDEERVETLFFHGHNYSAPCFSLSSCPLPTVPAFSLLHKHCTVSSRASSCLAWHTWALGGHPQTFCCASDPLRLKTLLTLLWGSMSTADIAGGLSCGLLVHHLPRTHEPSTTGFGLSRHRAQPTGGPEVALTHRPGRSTHRPAARWASTLQGVGSRTKTTGEVLDDGWEKPAPFPKFHHNYQTKRFTEASESWKRPRDEKSNFMQWI